ncbi:MAG: hypothetical protein FWD55_03680, partial [Propionibacteriaceae bacterium]|nr:hypothetical protein [Propionibacteriaceae bacterium]
SIPNNRDGSDWPVIFLPETITEEELRSLLAECPNFDPLQYEELNNWVKKNPFEILPAEEILPEPVIEISYNFDAAGPDWEPSMEDMLRLTKIKALNEILREQREQYLDEPK